MSKIVDVCIAEKIDFLKGNGNGRKKYIKHCNVPDDIEILVVPSSSTARPMKLSEKSEEWKKSISCEDILSME